MISRLGVLFMRAIAPLPLPWVRAMGRALGWLLYAVVPGRRHVVRVNLALCFPRWSEEERRKLVPRVFTAFAQAWLDRSWLWHAGERVVRRRV
jgi:Kdo2-lipid IVA lauroyltransferase/acyltransferase